jgi:hypothetical protein
MPANGSNRFGGVRLASGWLFAIAQWYPRLTVYGDLTG